ncbi:MFS transporter [Eggerthella guodeyinii]|uniref:MFS transporter n=1 Tax=Eggerthella guodeyinii TaxID=2690837 RepID=A0A6L7ISE4_9ACTN|nr:MFS transporter [Eggerthella guodeyinii]QOS67679.1 MFS transporter [Eggerthella guodeyinii]
MSTPSNAPDIDNNRGPVAAVGGRRLPRRWLAAVVAVWAGFAFTSFASMAANYAAVWYVTETTGSPLALAVVYVCAFLPVGLLAPLGGVVADRFNRKTVIIVCDLFIAAIALVVGVAIAVGHVSFPLVLVMATACGVAQAFRTPSFNATMPLLVPEKHLLRVNALDNLLSSISMICAPALGIFLYTTLGFQAVMFVDVAGALLSVLAMLAASVPTIVAHDVANQSALQNVKSGWRELSAAKGLPVVVLCVVLGMMAYGPLDSILPLMVSSHFNGNGYMASLVTAVFGIGMLAGSAALMVRGGSTWLARIIAVAAIVVGLATMVAGMLPTGMFTVFVIAIGVMAMACAGFNGPLMTLMQKNVDEEKLGRVMGLLSAFMGLGIPLGTAIGGAVAQGIGVTSFFVADGAVILALGAALLLMPSVRALDARTNALAAAQPAADAADAEAVAAE